jgi:hypothetical protein
VRHQGQGQGQDGGRQEVGSRAGVPARHPPGPDKSRLATAHHLFFSSDRLGFKARPEVGETTSGPFFGEGAQLYGKF